MRGQYYLADDAEDVLVAPGQVLHLHQPVVRVYPHELVGRGDGGAERLVAGPPPGPPVPRHRAVRLLVAVPGLARRHAAVRARHTPMPTA